MDYTLSLAYEAIIKNRRLCDNCKNCTAYSDDKNHFYCKLDGMQVLDYQFCDEWKAKK